MSNIEVILPDNSKILLNEGANGFDLAKNISEGLAKNAIALEINGDVKADFRAIYFDIDESVLVSRIVNRRSCPICGEIYNLKTKPTKVEGICDKCGTALVQRKDDNEETAHARFETYFKETAPLIDHYKNKGVLRTMNADGQIDEVWERLLEAIND